MTRIRQERMSAMFFLLWFRSFSLKARLMHAPGVRKYGEAHTVNKIQGC